MLELVLVQIWERRKIFEEEEEGTRKPAQGGASKLELELVSKSAQEGG